MIPRPRDPAHWHIQHVVADVKRIYSGLIVFRYTYPGGPPAWFANVNDPSFIFKNAIYVAQIALGDGVVIYRCYVVWGSIWIIVLPVILWLSMIASGSGGVHIISQPTADSGDIFVQRSGQWITAFYSTTLACNLCATGLLAYRLWTIERSVHRTSAGGRSLTRPVLMVIIDAGVLYSATLLTALVCFVRKSMTQYIVFDTIFPIISIVFYMVILRTGMAQISRSREGTVDSGLQRSPVPRGEATHRFQPMHVHIERLTEVDHELGSKADEVESHQMSRV